MRLLFKGISVHKDEQPKYTFNLDGTDVELLRRDALDLVSSIPNELRNCKVAFDSVVLKAKYRQNKI